MLRKEIYKEILESIAANIDLSSKISQDDCEEFHDHCSRFKIPDAISILSPQLDEGLSGLVNFISSISEESLDDDITYTGTAIAHEVKDEIRKTHLKALVHSSSDIVLFTSLSLFKEDSIIPYIDDIILRAIENLWVVAAVDTKNNLLQSVQSYRSDYLFVCTTYPVATDDDIWKLYSYAYLCKVNDDKFPVPIDLLSTLSRSAPSLNWDQRLKYEQFFDVYNVLNEAKHSPDLLSYYLKIYQVYEYLAYRRKLAELANGSPETRQSFVRSVISRAEDLRNKEKDIIVSVTSSILPAASANLDALFQNTDTKQFLNNVYLISEISSPVKPKEIAATIYQVRNSIVHNKATELHFTYGNVNEYKKIIPLIRELTVFMSQAIIGFLSDYSKRKVILEFDKRELNLY